MKTAERMCFVIKKVELAERESSFQKGIWIVKIS